VNRSLGTPSERRVWCTPTSTCIRRTPTARSNSRTCPRSLARPARPSSRSPTTTARTPDSTRRSSNATTSRSSTASSYASKPTASVDLLGYGVSETPALADLVDRIQTDRAQRGQTIIDNVEGELGIDLDIEGRPGLGRPNVARAVADHPDTDHSVQGVFDDLIGNDGPCYVARDVPDFETGRDVLQDACAFVGLAHPFRYDDPDAALALTETLDAVERDYTYGDDVDVDLAAVDAVAAEHDLLVTAGTDAHEHTVGVEGLDETEYEPIRDALAARAE